ncbi:MAG: glutamyl-tRNA reductase [Actinomycetota bacterium]|nr:glutamyl-tRNA reductase [Actinomycetota bacterium]
MSLLVVGVNHTTASAALRELVAFDEATYADAYRQLLAEPDVTEVLVVSTCNRCEVYLDIKDASGVKERVSSVLSSVHGLLPGQRRELHDVLYVRSGAQMVSHLFAVVSSLDSLVMGETQIVAQLKDAWRRARGAGALKDPFEHLFQQAFWVGKRVRNETGFGRCTVSVPQMAVDLVERELGGLGDRNVCVVGAGKMAGLIVDRLAVRGVSGIRIANRTLEPARELAARAGGRACTLDMLPELLAWADVLVTATGAPGCLVTGTMLDEVSRRAPLLIVDLALPRDVDPACAHREGVLLFGIDDLGGAAGDGHGARHAEAHHAEVRHAWCIVEDETERFLSWMQEREVAPTIAQIYRKMERFCAGELEDALRELSLVEGRELNEQEREVLVRLARSIGRKVVHGPAVRLKKQATVADSYRYTDAARYLFGLDTSPLGRRCRSCERARECRAGEDGRCLVAMEEER